MNIFNALTLGNGSISETNLTSFLSYSFNETNDYSASLLLLLLDEIESRIDGFSFNDLLDTSGSNFRDRVNNFKHSHSYRSQPEFHVQSGKSRYIDIMVTISDKNKDNDCCYLLIENKVNRSACKEEQCTEQFLMFNQMEDFEQNVPTFSILITPDIDIFSTMLDDVKKTNKLSAWLKWQSEKETSMIDIFRQLIELENKSEIGPIDQNVQYIIKSFVDYIATTLSSKGRTTNFTIAGSEVIDEASVQIGSSTYSLRRYDNNAIRLFNEENVIINEPVKPVLREVILKYNLGIELERKPGKMKNTRRLGREVIRGLKSI